MPVYALGILVNAAMDYMIARNAEEFEKMIIAFDRNRAISGVPTAPPSRLVVSFGAPKPWLLAALAIQSCLAYSSCLAATVERLSCHRLCGGCDNTTNYSHQRHIRGLAGELQRPLFAVAAGSLSGLPTL